MSVVAYPYGCTDINRMLVYGVTCTVTSINEWQSIRARWEPMTASRECACLMRVWYWMQLLPCHFLHGKRGMGVMRAYNSHMYLIIQTVPTNNVSDFAELIWTSALKESELTASPFRL